MRTAKKLANMITDLAVLKDVSINKMLQECNLKKGVIDGMKNGAMPSVDKVILIADYFSVSVEYLMGVTADPTQPKKYDYRDYGLKEDPFAQTDTDNTEYMKMLDRISEIPFILQEEDIKDVCDYVNFLIYKDHLKYSKRLDDLKNKK